MTELEKAARMALEALQKAVPKDAKQAREQLDAIAALTQALATTERKGPLSKDRIREVFLSHGFTVKDGQTDLKPYVYDAANALIALVQPATERKGEPFPGYVQLAETLIRIQRNAYLSRDDQIALSHAADTLASLPLLTERKGEPVWSDMGAWLWAKLADYCRRKGLNPHHENDLFNMAGELRSMLAHTSPQVPEDTALLDFMEDRRVSLIPEYEGPWTARQYDDDPQFAADAEGATPRDALRALFDAARKGEKS